MQPSTTLTLGDFTFSGTEIPERLPFGGDHALVVHRLVGGKRIIDAMGPDPAPVDWSGVLFGADALKRARYLDNLRMRGTPLTLAWSELRYTVIVRSFRASFELAYNIPYSISCEVVSFDSQPVTSAPSAGVDVWVQQDAQAAGNLADAIGDSKLSELVAAMQSATAAVSNFATASQAAINSVLVPVQAVQSAAQTMLATAANTINSVATVGGILPNNPVAAQAARLTGQVAAMTQAPLLLQLSSTVGRIAANVGQARSGSTITVAGGNLFDLAADAYGDASEWSTIARANGLTDPMLSGVSTLSLPAEPDGMGGVTNV